QDIVGDVEHPLASRLEVAVGRRGPKGAKDKPCHVHAGVDLRSHRRDVQDLVETQGGHDPFEYHAPPPPDPSATPPSPGSVPAPRGRWPDAASRLARWLSSGTVKKPHSNA